MSDVRRRNFEEFDRLMREWEDEKQREVEALGFASWEEYNKHHAKRLREGIRSCEEHEKDGSVFQGEDVEYPQFGTDSDSPECACEEHFLPCFCPQRLSTYRSMGDIDLSGLIKLQNATRMRVQLDNLDERDFSGTTNRIPAEDLERLWVMNSQQTLLQLPPWTDQDPVLQRIIDAEARACTVPSSSYSPGSARSFMIATPRTPQIQTTAKILTTSSRTGETSIRNETIVAKPEMSPKSDSITQDQLLAHSKGGAQCLATRKQHSTQRCSKARKANRTALTKVSGIKKRSIHMSPHAQSSKPCHSMATRSQGVTIFHALNANSAKS